MKTTRSLRTRAIVINAVLFGGLMIALLAYPIIVSDLPARLYTTAQVEFLHRNAALSLNQSALAWNILGAADPIIHNLLPLKRSRVRAVLAARYEENNNVNVAAYDLEFSGEYLLANADKSGYTIVELFFPFPDSLETLHEVRLLVDGEEPADARYSLQGISWTIDLVPGEERQIEVGYKAQGANSFTYTLNHDQRTDVDVIFTVEGLTGGQISANSLPPSNSEVSSQHETFIWDYDGLIPSRDIQLALPTQLSFVQRVEQLQGDFRTLAIRSPFLVGLLLVCLAVVLRLSGKHLPLESYLLIGCSTALFYPLLTFLSGLMEMYLAAPLAFLLVSCLILTFVSLLTGWRRIWWRAGMLLLIFLGAFSLSVLTPWEELLMSAGGLALVGMLMLLYARRPLPGEAETTAPPIVVEVED
jgi:hypothetical protein